MNGAATRIVSLNHVAKQKILSAIWPLFRAAIIQRVRTEAPSVQARNVLPYGHFLLVRRVAPVQTKRRKGSNGSEFPAKMRLSTRYQNYVKYVIIHQRSSKFVQNLFCTNDELIEGEGAGVRKTGRGREREREREREGGTEATAKQKSRKNRNQFLSLLR